VHNHLTDTTGRDLASVLETVDAVIATPSTVLLEAMLQGVPVAVLDYHNRPHYVPAAWCITAAAHFDEIVPQLARPSEPLMLYQQSILADALECRTPATPRLVELADTMRRIAHDCLTRGARPAFPRRILADPQDGHHLPMQSASIAAGLDRCIERQAAATADRLARELAEAQCELAQLKRRTLRARLNRLTRKLRKLVGLPAPAAGSGGSRRAA
jgi:hypothetical protein